jgi:hypothetical protein
MPASDPGSARAAPSYLEALVVVGIFLSLTLLVTFPLVLSAGRSVVGLVDPTFNEWVLGWVSDRFRHGGAGLFDAPILYPYRHTLGYSEPLLGIAILVAPIYWVTGNAMLTHNAALIGSFVLAGAGMYLLVRSLTGRRDAAVIAGLAFAFCPYRLVQIPIIQMLMSGWMPIAIWALRRYFDTGRWSALGGFIAAVVVESLTSVYFPFFLAIPVTVMTVATYARRPRPSLRTSVQLAMAASIIAAVLAPVAVIHSRVLREQDGKAEVAESSSYGADVASYGRVDSRIRIYARVGSQPGSEGNLFPGATVIVLAAIALWPVAGTFSGDTGRLATWLDSTRAQFVCIAAIAFVLSLGMQPTAFGHRLLDHGPFAWLAAVVPGLNAMRVPARFGMVVHLALAVLAGYGAARILPHLRAPWGVVTAVALATAIVAEGYAAPLTLYRMRRAGSFDHREAWRWLLTQPALPMIELPILDLAYPDHHARDVQEGTLFHGRPIVNGSSRFPSEVQNLLGSIGSPLADPAQLRDAFSFLQQLKVGYVLIHPGWYGDQSLAKATVAHLQSAVDQVADHRDFGDTLVFRLRPSPDLATVDHADLVASNSYRMTSSHDAAHLPFLSDGDLRTGWSTGEPQQGHEWISLEFSTVRDLAAVRLELRARNLREYPRRLTIESSSGGADFIPVFSGSILPQLGRAFLIDTRRIVVDVPLARNHTRVLRIRQVGSTAPWQWALQELSVLQRADGD